MRRSGLPLTTYVEPHMAEQLRACAKASDRSIAAEIRQAIRAHVLATLRREAGVDTHRLTTSEGPAGQPDLRDNPGVEPADNVVLEA